MASPIRPSQHGGCALWQTNRMSHYCYRTAEIGSLNFVVPILADPCAGVKADTAHEICHDPIRNPCRDGNVLHLLEAFGIRKNPVIPAPRYNVRSVRRVTSVGMRMVTFKRNHAGGFWARSSAAGDETLSTG